MTAILKKTSYIVIIIILSNCNQTNMQESKTQTIVRDQQQNIIAELGVKDGQLNGLAIWYNTSSNPVSCGLFFEGKPYTGTFVNWSEFIDDWGDDPYVLEKYAKDYMTMFENGPFGIDRPIDGLIETYVNGTKIDP